MGILLLLYASLFVFTLCMEWVGIREPGMRAVVNLSTLALGVLSVLLYRRVRADEGKERGGRPEQAASPEESGDQIQPEDGAPRGGTGRAGGSEEAGVQIHAGAGAPEAFEGCEGEPEECGIQIQTEAGAQGAGAGRADAGGCGLQPGCAEISEACGFCAGAVLPENCSLRPNGEIVSDSFEIVPESGETVSGKCETASESRCHCQADEVAEGAAGCEDDAGDPRTQEAKEQEWIIDRAAYLILAHEKGLTRRETEIAFLAVNGYSNQRLAEELYISVATVKKHLTHIYEKTGANGRRALRETIKNYCNH